MGHGRGDRPEADPLGDAQPMGELDDGVGHGPPAIVRLRADEHEEVAVGATRVRRITSSGQVSSASRPSTISSGGRRAR